MTSKRIRSLFLFLAMSTCVFLLNITLVSASLRSDTSIVSRTQSFSAAALSLPDYDSGWINLQKATLGSGSYPPVYPADTSLAHNLDTYDVLVQVLAADVSGNYVQVPNPIIGSGSAEDNWFLTSPNQILLRNWDPSRTVPVRVMIWKLTPDYNSGWVTLPKASTGTGTLPPVYPTNTSLAHNLGTYDVFVQVLAADVSGKYAQVPSSAIGSYGGEDNWFLTSPNQILLKNYDASRTVPVRVMIWKLTPDYNSGWVTLPKASTGTGIYPGPVYPTNTSLAHNLETYDMLVQVLAADVSGNYVQVPNPIIGSGSREDNWFLTSPNQILLKNYDASRTVPVRVMMWKLSALVQATFSQTGVSPNFTGTVLTVDGSSYGVADLPISFSFDIGSSHIFSFASPLIEGSKQYVWNSTSGLSALQNGALTMNTSGSIVGNYLQQDVKLHNVAISNISSSQSVIVQGYSGHLTLTVQNLGSFNEDFNVTVYANSTIINTLNLNLLNGSTMTQNLLWNTTGFAYGNYKISAYAWPVPGETDYTDNNFTSSWIISLIEGQNLPQFYCDEYSFSTSSASINSTFKVEIRVANWSAPGVIGYEFSLTYDNTMLEAVAAEIPTGHWFTPTIKPSNFFPVDSGTIDQTAGRVKFAAALLAPELGKTGSGVVADVTFRILKSPSADETISCDLGLSNVIMVNPSAQVISPSNYTILDGRFVFAWASQLRTDLNGDRAVNIVDISIAARAVFTHPGDPGWNAAADLNDDETINVIDIVIIAKDYGRTY